MSTELQRLRAQLAERDAEVQAAKTAWSDQWKAVQSLKERYAPPSELNDALFVLNRLSEKQAAAEQMRGLTVHRLAVEEREHCKQVRAKLLQQYAAQVEAIGLTVAMLMEVDKRAGSAVPTAVGLGRIALPEFDGQHGIGNGMLLDFQSLGTYANRAAQSLDAILIADEAKQQPVEA